MPIVCSRACALSRLYLDLKGLLSRCSTKAHTFVAAWGVYPLIGGCPPFNTPSLFGEANPMEIELNEDDQVKLKYLLAAMIA